MSGQWYCPKCGPLKPEDAQYPGLGSFHYCRKCIDVRLYESIPPFVTAMQEEMVALKKERAVDAILKNSADKLTGDLWDKITEQDKRIAALEAGIGEMSQDPMGDYYTGLRCGVEDWNIHCRYEAAEYGWQQAFEYIGSIANNFLQEPQG